MGVTCNNCWKLCGFFKIFSVGRSGFGTRCFWSAPLPARGQGGFFEDVIQCHTSISVTPGIGGMGFLTGFFRSVQGVKQKESQHLTTAFLIPPTDRRVRWTRSHCSRPCRMGGITESSWILVAFQGATLINTRFSNHQMG